MQDLNYHHLLYFWTAATEGGIAAASRKLRLSQPTISTQIRLLEEAVGEQLFVRARGGLLLTDAGRLTFRYAHEIFSLGRELQANLEGGAGVLAERLVVGIVQALPKLVAFRLLQPVLHLSKPIRLEVHEDDPERLLADLSLHALDVVLSDQPAPASTRAKVFSHLLGDSGVSFFATPALAARHRRGFPRSLDGAPMILPGLHTVLRRSIDDWLVRQGVRPQIVGELDDSALLKVFGEHGAGIFVAPTVIEEEVRRQYRVAVVHREERIRERFYAITIERRITHPAVLAISATARDALGGGAVRRKAAK